ncbi:hypothetical protein ACQ4PT_068928 [Festuca glaucescens]
MKERAAGMRHGEVVQVGVDTLHVVPCRNPPARRAITRIGRSADAAAPRRSSDRAADEGGSTPEGGEASIQKRCRRAGRPAAGTARRMAGRPAAGTVCRRVGRLMIMDAPETHIADASKEPIHIRLGSDTTLVEETNNSSGFTQAKEVIDNIAMDVDVPKEANPVGPEAIFMEGTLDSNTSTNPNEVHTEIIIARHNKPKKSNINVIPKDYVCTTEDFALVESIMSATKNTKFVDIGDALLTNDNLQCLTRDDGFLPDDVINAYIYCMCAYDHLLDRADGKIFLSINISKTHWYLAVVNAKKRLIQVLDSLGPGMSRSDLILVLRRLQKHLKIASQRKGFDIGEKWQDLDVLTWPIVEHVQKPVQTDGASCGLFMLNFMEYWTGDMLSDNITQEDMKSFRRKLVAILHDSELNKIRGSPIYDQYKDQENESDSDITELPSLQEEHPRDVARENNPLPICTVSTNPHMLVDEICKYIMSIDDATCLKKEWVRSSKPYPLGLTLKKIQDILRMDQPMDKDCFNMASAMLDGTRHPSWRVKPNINELATLFHSWPGIDNNISLCNMIYLPHASLGDFILFTIDKHERRVSILDPFSEPL